MVQFGRWKNGLFFHISPNPVGLGAYNKKEKHNAFEGMGAIDRTFYLPLQLARHPPWTSWLGQWKDNSDFFF